MIPPLSTMRHRLRMRHLHLLLALSEQSSLRGAAAQMAITQPAVTKILQELETVLGAPLFTRHASGVASTVFGQAAMRYARVVFEDLGQLREELAAIEAGDVGRIRVGAVMAASPDVLTPAIVALKHRHPRLHVAVQIETSDILAQLVQQGQIDLMIGRIPEGWPSHDLSFEPLSEEILSIVARVAHPACALRQDAALSSLADFAWILQPHPSPMRQIIDHSFREARLPTPASTIETSSILTTLSLLLESEMLAVLPASVARYYQDKGMIAVLPAALHGRLAPYGFILRKNRRVTPATQLMIDAIREASGGLAHSLG